MSSTKMGPFCAGGDGFRNICISPYPPYWYHSLSPFALWRHYMETWGIHGSTANSPHKGLVTQALIFSFMVTKQTFGLPVIWEAGGRWRPCDWETVADLSFIGSFGHWYLNFSNVIFTISGTMSPISCIFRGTWKKSGDLASGITKHEELITK